MLIGLLFLGSISAFAADSWCDYAVEGATAFTSSKVKTIQVFDTLCIIKSVSRL